ncbi:cysteine desulfurase [Proteiniclasticum sp. BAD-10]|uniref:cysteine desulfurase n=1 Tax=Proteiniclasticum sediminis TaxID=2804028 RepID=A0A941CR51_9CLOT|nr:cysteine desulfurase family protein [Proteiniclasticum sediminis]MBR0575796.1 cysteine desulfurase [Proteiniclasticum sediminis]
MEAYLDNAATTPMHKQAVRVMADALENEYGNPNSLHQVGRRAEDALERARKTLAQSIGAAPGEIIFTSGATEGNNQILRSFIKEGAHIITSAIEHPSVLRTLEYAKSQGVRVDFLGVDALGRIDPLELEAKITKDTVLVSLMMVNNEMGAIQDLAALAPIIRRKSRRAKFHSDAVQGYLKLPLEVKKADLDFLTVSAHKVHGPKGCGFVYVRKGQRPASLLLGGEQEQGLRAGTVNVPAIVGFEAAVNALAPHVEENAARVKNLKAELLRELSSLEGIQVNSPLEETSPYILSIGIPGTRGEVMLHYLSDKGVYVSTGSACTSKDTKDSHVLQALKLPEAAIKGSIRISLTETTTLDEVRHGAAMIKEAVNFLRRK